MFLSKRKLCDFTLFLKKVHQWLCKFLFCFNQIIGRLIRCLTIFTRIFINASLASLPSRSNKQLIFNDCLINVKTTLPNRSMLYYKFSSHCVNFLSTWQFFKACFVNFCRNLFQHYKKVFFLVYIVYKHEGFFLNICYTLSIIKDS